VVTACIAALRNSYSRRTNFRYIDSTLERVYLIRSFVELDAIDIEITFKAYINKFCIVAEGEEVRPGGRDVDKEALEAARNVLTMDDSTRKEFRQAIEEKRHRALEEANERTRVLEA
jgi:hypothetical protein